MVDGPSSAVSSIRALAELSSLGKRIALRKAEMKLAEADVLRLQQERDDEIRSIANLQAKIDRSDRAVVELEEMIEFLDGAEEYRDSLEGEALAVQLLAEVRIRDEIARYTNRTKNDSEY